jgi:hypothetical protein
LASAQNLDFGGSSDTRPESALDLRKALGEAPVGRLWVLSRIETGEQEPTYDSRASSADMLSSPSKGIFLGVREATEDFQGAAYRATASPQVAKWVAGIRSAVDKWIVRSPERADLVGGWFHDYIDQKTGAPLAWTAETPEPPDGTSEREIRFKQAWVTRMREINIVRMLDAARLFRVAGDPRYGEWAARQLDFYAQNYARWPLRTFNGRARMFRHGLDEAVWSFPLTDVARLLEGFVEPRRSERWRTDLFLPMAENLKVQTSPLSNIGLWHSAAIAAIAMRYKDDELLAFSLEGPHGVRNTIATSMTQGGIWNEQSFAYNAYVVDALSRLLVRASLEGYSELVRPEAAVALRLMLAPLDYQFDDGTLPNHSDSLVRQRGTKSPMFLSAYRVLPTYFGLSQAREAMTWDALLDPPAPLRAGAPAILKPRTRNIESNRMAVLRTGAWQAFVHWGQLTPHHSQSEVLSFEVYHGATPITTDSGITSYASDLFKDYLRRAPANNVPLVDGIGQTSWGSATVEEFAAEDSRLVVKYENYSEGVSVRRGYRTTRHGFVERTDIAIDPARGLRRLGVAFHTPCEVQPDRGLVNHQGGEKPPQNPATRYWTKTKAMDAGAHWTLLLRCAGEAYQLSVSGPARQRVFVSEEPTTPVPKTRTVVYYDTLALDAEFETELRKR